MSSREENCEAESEMETKVRFSLLKCDILLINLMFILRRNVTQQLGLEGSLA